jgi:hypothetical protein
MPMVKFDKVEITGGDMIIPSKYRNLEPLNNFGSENLSF